MKKMIFGGFQMNNYCAFSEDQACIKWMDYEIIHQELEEVDELCHGNWIEIGKNLSYPAIYFWIAIKSHIQKK